MAEKGVLTKQDERWLRKILDHVCVLKGWQEMIDGPSFGILISMADNYVVEKYISPEDVSLVKDLITVCKTRNIVEIKNKINEILNLTNPLVISLEQAALTFIMAAVYEWADNLTVIINNDKNV